MNLELIWELLGFPRGGKKGEISGLTIDRKKIWILDSFWEGLGRVLEGFGEVLGWIWREFWEDFGRSGVSGAFCGCLLLLSGVF